MKEAMEAASRDALVVALGDLMGLLGRLPGGMGDTAWNVLVAVQDWRYGRVLRWHLYVQGCRGRSP